MFQLVFSKYSLQIHGLERRNSSALSKSSHIVFTEMTNMQLTMFV